MERFGEFWLDWFVFRILGKILFDKNWEECFLLEDVGGNIFFFFLLEMCLSNLDIVIDFVVFWEFFIEFVWGILNILEVDYKIYIIIIISVNILFNNY